MPATFILAFSLLAKEIFWKIVHYHKKEQFTSFHFTEAGTGGAL